MFRKITLLQSTSKCWAITGPTPQIHRWCVVVGPRLGQQQYFNCQNVNVGLMLDQCQHANNDVLPTPQPLPNVGPMITCYLEHQILIWFILPWFEPT